MSNSELTVIIERYKKDLITMDNAIGLIKGIVYAKELLHEATQRSILQEQLDEIYEVMVGDNGRERYTHEEIIDRAKEYYDCYAWVCDFGSFVDVHHDLVKQRGEKS